MWISKGEWVSEKLKMGSRNENFVVLETLQFLMEIACARSAPRKKWEIGIVFIGNCDQNLHNTISIWNYFGVLTNTISILNNTGFFSGALRAQIEIEITPKFCSFFCISNFNVEILELEGGDNYTISPVQSLLPRHIRDFHHIFVLSRTILS